MISPQRENAPAGEEIEILGSVFVPEIASLAADVLTVKTDGPQDLDESRIQMLGMQVKAAPAVLLQPLHEILVHTISGVGKRGATGVLPGKPWRYADQGNWAFYRRNRGEGSNGGGRDGETERRRD